MNTMTKYVTGLAAGLVLSAVSTQASLITINSGVAPQPANQGSGTVATWLAAGVTTYNNTHNPDLPAPGPELVGVNTGNSAPSGYPTFVANTLTISIPTGGYDYVVLHWGGQGGGPVQSFYIGAIGGATPSPVVFNSPDRNGLSFYRLYHETTRPPGNAPDGGATAGLLGVAACTMEALRRRLMA